MSITAALGEGVSTGPSAPATRTRKRSRSHWVLLGPGLAYLVLLFVVPVGALLATSLYVPVPGGDIGQYQPALHWQNYVDAMSQFWPVMLRSFWFALVATVAALVIGYPMAYAIAIRARGRKLLQGMLLVLVVAPFFTSFILRTIAWKQILADDSLVVAHPALAQPAPRGRPPDRDPLRGRLRPDLQLPAVHGAADLRGAGAAGRADARGGRRPVRVADHHVPHGDLAALAARCRRRAPC